MLRSGLGQARKERAERDVVGAGIGGDDRAIPTVAAGDPDDAVRAQQPARLGVRHVLLADMHPVAIELGGEVRAVVHDEGDAAPLRDRLQHPRGAPNRGVVDLLQPELQAGGIAAGERFLEVARKAIGVERGRGDQVEPSRRPRLVARKGLNGQSFPW